MSQDNTERSSARKSGIAGFWERVNALCNPVVQLIEVSPALRLLSTVGAMLGFVVLIATAYQIAWDLADRRDERAIRREESIARAWDRLLTRSPGNIGKGQALTFLASEKIDISGIDLSCEAVGGWHPVRGCIRPSVFTGITIEGGRDEVGFSEFDGYFLWSIDLRDAVIKNLYLRNTVIQEGNFRWVLFDDARIHHSVLSGIWVGSRISSAELRDVRISSLTNDLEEGENFPSIDLSEISGSELRLASIESSIEGNVLAWADWPPVLMDDNLDVLPWDEELGEKVTFCDPSEANKRLKDADKTLRESIIAQDGVMKGLPTNCDKISFVQAKTKFPEAFEAE